jgi:hypothetical protein
MRNTSRKRIKINANLLFLLVLGEDSNSGNFPKVFSELEIRRLNYPLNCPLPSDCLKTRFLSGRSG